LVTGFVALPPQLSTIALLRYVIFLTHRAGRRRAGAHSSVGPRRSPSIPPTEYTRSAVSVYLSSRDWNQPAAEGRSR